MNITLFLPSAFVFIHTKMMLRWGWVSLGWNPNARPERDGAKCGQANFQQNVMLGPDTKPERTQASEAGSLKIAAAIYA